jgi:hypothetical protein
MLSVTVGKVTFHFEPLIAYGIIVGVVLLLLIIRAVAWAFRFRKICEAVTGGRYDDIIRDGENLLYAYEKQNARMSNKRLVSQIEYLNFALAISYFACDNDELFLKHVNALTTSLDAKNSWLSLFYLKKNDFDTAATYCDELSCNENIFTMKTFLDGFRAYQDNDHDAAKKKMAEINDQLTHPVLKNMANEILQ